MSMEALAWAAKQPVTPVSRKYVLSTLADRANAKGECWPSIAEICEVVGLHDRMVRRHIQALARDGYLSSEKRGRESNAYRLNITGTAIPVKGASSGTGVPVNAGTPVPDSEIDNRYSSTADLEPLTGTPVHLNRYSSTSPVPLNNPPYPQGTQKNPKEDAAVAASPTHTRIREAPAWLADLYRLGWAEGDPLTEKETNRLIADFGSLDLSDEVERFRAYWSRKGKPPGTWNTYLRLRTWLGKASKGWNGNGTNNRTGFGSIPRRAGDLSIAANA